MVDVVPALFGQILRAARRQLVTFGRYFRSFGAVVTPMLVWANLNRLIANLGPLRSCLPCTYALSNSTTCGGAAISLYELDGSGAGALYEEFILK